MQIVLLDRVSTGQAVLDLSVQDAGKPRMGLVYAREMTEATLERLAQLHEKIYATDQLAPFLAVLAGLKKLPSAVKHVDVYGFGAMHENFEALFVRGDVAVRMGEEQMKKALACA